MRLIAEDGNKSIIALALGEGVLQGLHMVYQLIPNV